MNKKMKMNRGGGGAKRIHQFARLAYQFGEDLNSLNQSKDKSTLANKRNLIALLPHCLSAFTLAEVLITLAIIGIVASLTIPTLVTNYKKKTYVTQLKKTYNYLTNGFHQIMAQDGVSNLTDTKLWSKIPTEYTIPAHTLNMGSFSIDVPETTMPKSNLSTSDLLENYVADFKNELLKTFNVAAIYNENNIPNEYKISYKYLVGDNSLSPITSGIYLNDGSYLDFILYKTPGTRNCGGELTGMMPVTFSGGHTCTSLKDFQESKNAPTKLWQLVGYINIDINGIKGPNRYGRDYFKFILGNDGNLYPYGGIDDAVYQYCDYNRTPRLQGCTNYWRTNLLCDLSYQYSGYGCAARIMEEGWEMRY